jgi:hypothetical protein
MMNTTDKTDTLSRRAGPPSIGPVARSVVARARATLALALSAITTVLMLAGPSAAQAADGDVALQSWANRLYVLAETGYQGADSAMLRAATTDPWTRYEVTDLGGCASPRPLVECRTMALRSFRNGLYVSAELGYPAGDYRYGMLRARSGSIGPWERFRIYRDQGSGEVSIQSEANQKYVSVELGYQGNAHAMLRARSTVVGPWEKFYMPYF